MAHPPPGRRLTLSPIGFDIVLALSQTPDGIRLADIAHVIGSPISSAQTALRILVANDIAQRLAKDPPRYRLAPGHPAHDELISLAAVLPEAPHAIGVVLRANQAIAYAGVDADGFVASLRTDAPVAALEALDRQLTMVSGARPNAPEVVRIAEDELERHLRVAIGLRARVRRAVTIKGVPPAGARDTPAGGQRAAG
jgi:hypothetical protein